MSSVADMPMPYARDPSPGAAAPANAPANARPSIAGYWFLGLSGVAFMAPAFMAMLRESWSTEQGAQGPLVLASGLWLLAHEARGVVTVSGRAGIPAAALALAGIVVAFGRVTGTLWIDWTASYAALVVVLYAIIGGAALRRLWFPLVYLLFLVPVPYAIVGPLTHMRKLWLSGSAVDLLAWAGYDVAYGGTTLYIDQYELLIADACAGMNSLFSLVAIGSFYIYIRHRRRLRPALILAAMLVPVAVLTNLVRVVLLMLVTRHAGDALAQGIFHDAIGMVMFAIMLACLVAIDLLVSLRPVRRARA